MHNSGRKEFLVASIIIFKKENDQFCTLATLRAMQLAVSNVKRTFKRHQPSPTAPLKFALC